MNGEGRNQENLIETERGIFQNYRDFCLCCFQVHREWVETWIECRKAERQGEVSEDKSMTPLMAEGYPIRRTDPTKEGR